MATSGVVHLDGVVGAPHGATDAHAPYVYSPCVASGDVTVDLSDLLSTSAPSCTDATNSASVCLSVRPSQASTESSAQLQQSQQSQREQPSKSDLQVLRDHRASSFRSHPRSPPRGLSAVRPALEQQLVCLFESGSHAGAVSLLRLHVASGDLLVTQRALHAAIATADAELVSCVALYPLADLSPLPGLPSPLLAAVRRRNARMVRVLLRAPLPDAPPCEALQLALGQHDVESVRALLSTDLVNPNKCGALQQAVGQRDAEMVRALLANHRVNVNRLCSGLGSTALCRAIDLGESELVDMLLAHPKIDINKGFLLTPLQHAVDARSPQMVRRLVAARTAAKLAPNKSLGTIGSPLAAAVRQGPDAAEMVRLLLSCPDTVVGPEVVEELERQDNAVLDALVVRSGRPLHVGRRWRARVVRLVLVTLMLEGAAVANVVAGAIGWAGGHSVYAALTLAVVVVGNLACCLLLRWRRGAASGDQAAAATVSASAAALPLRVLPAAYDLCLMVATLRAAFGGSLAGERSVLFNAFKQNARYQAFLVSFPLCWVQMLFVWWPAGVGSTTPVYVCAACNLLCVCTEAVRWAATRCGKHRGDEEGSAPSATRTGSDVLASLANGYLKTRHEENESVCASDAQQPLEPLSRKTSRPPRCVDERPSRSPFPFPFFIQHFSPSLVLSHSLDIDMITKNVTTRVPPRLAAACCGTKI